MKEYFNPDFETPEDIKEGVLLEDIESVNMYDGGESPILIVLDGTHIGDIENIDISINFREDR